MRTNIVIDDALIAKAMNYTKLRTKKEVVHFALEEIAPYLAELTLRA